MRILPSAISIIVDLDLPTRCACYPPFILNAPPQATDFIGETFLEKLELAAGNEQSYSALYGKTAGYVVKLMGDDRALQRWGRDGFVRNASLEVSLVVTSDTLKMTKGQKTAIEAAFPSPTAGCVIVMGGTSLDGDIEGLKSSEGSSVVDLLEGGGAMLLLLLLLLLALNRAR
jgi:hypothetical protein